MNENTSEIKQALADLNKAAAGRVDALENELRPQIQKLTSDVSETVKAFDQFQINNKGNASSYKQDNSFQGQLQKSLMENTDNLAKLGKSEIKSFRFEIKAAGDMTMANNYSGAGVVTSSTPVGIIGMPNTMRHVRDLLRQTTMTGSSLPILRDSGGEGAPAPVAQGALKPQFDFDLSEISAKAETIAGVVVFAKQFLDDIPSARSWLTQKMIEVYMAAEDDQLLNGDGTSPNLSGINDAGNFTAAASISTNDVIQLVSGILQLRALGRNPSGIVINASNYESILLNTASGSGEFNLPSYVTVGPTGNLSILGVPVIDLTSQTLNRFNIIDNNGSIMAIRQNTTIEFFEDAALARYNKIMARIESRIAYPTYGSTYAIQGTFTP